MEYNQYQPSGGYQVVPDTAVVQRTMQRTFLWMTLGLAITTLSSLFVVESGLALSILAGGSRMPFFILLIAELGLVWYLSSAVMKMRTTTATLLFALYSALNGVTLSPIFYAYTMESITTTFAITAATFAVTAIYGAVTKRDLSRWGSILFMGIIGIIIASLINMFVGSSGLSLIISYVGVLLFTGLTAYDSQRIKEMLAATSYDEQLSKRVSILGALTLYLDFINLFIYLLRILGRSRD